MGNLGMSQYDEALEDLFQKLWPAINASAASGLRPSSARTRFVSSTVAEISPLASEVCMAARWGEEATRRGGGDGGDGGGGRDRDPRRCRR